MTSKMALNSSSDHQTSFESPGLLVQEKKFEMYIFKMVAIAAILDFQSK